MYSCTWFLLIVQAYLQSKFQKRLCCDNLLIIQDAILLISSLQVHLLSDENRGATMEAVVSRMKTVQKFIKKEISSNGDKSQMMRIIAVSATIPNVEDVSLYLIWEI